MVLSMMVLFSLLYIISFGRHAPTIGQQTPSIGFEFNSDHAFLDSTVPTVSQYISKKLSYNIAKVTYDETDKKNIF